jgi:hypothetical protein
MYDSILTHKQTKTVEKIIRYDGRDRLAVLNIRWDDDCRNGHNSFAITLAIYSGKTTATRMIAAGCQHDLVVKHFPAYKHLIKWHAVSSDEPMYYVANTVYHAEQGNAAYAASTAVWPKLETNTALLSDPIALTAALTTRLPALMAEFKEELIATVPEFVW